MNTETQRKEDEIVATLMEVKDPEIDIDIWTLGLIYDIQVKDEKNVTITMTMTTPTCPYAPIIIESTKTATQSLGYDNVKIDITFDPPWEPPPFLRESLGI